MSLKTLALDDTAILSSSSFLEVDFQEDEAIPTNLDLDLDLELMRCMAKFWHLSSGKTGVAQPNHASVSP